MCLLYHWCILFVKEYSSLRNLALAKISTGGKFQQGGFLCRGPKPPPPLVFWNKLPCPSTTMGVRWLARITQFNFFFWRVTRVYAQRNASRKQEGHKHNRNKATRGLTVFFEHFIPFLMGGGRSPHRVRVQQPHE